MDVIISANTNTLNLMYIVNDTEFANLQKNIEDKNQFDSLVKKIKPSLALSSLPIGKMRSG